MAAVKFWARRKFKGTAALKKKINPTRIPIEKKANLKQSTQLLDHQGRCIHIGDRESDIYELFCAAQEIGTHFLIRTCLARDGDHTIGRRNGRGRRQKGSIASNLETATAIPTRPFLRSGIARFASCRRSESRSAIPL